MINKKVVVVIVGGAGVIGSSFCNIAAEKGYQVVLADINLEEASKVADRINSKLAGNVYAEFVDITDKNSIDMLINKVYKNFGCINAVVNNAYPRNGNYGRKLEDVTYDDFCENTNLHLGGYFLVMQRFAIFFSEHGGGNIINMSSIYGVMPPRFNVYSKTEMTMPVEYAAIKSAIIHLTKYFAQYFKSHAVRVNCISPGGILSNQPQIFLDAYKAYSGSKGLLDPEDVCGALSFLLSGDSAFVTGQNIVVDDGFSL